LTSRYGSLKFNTKEMIIGGVSNRILCACAESRKQIVGLGHSNQFLFPAPV